MMTAFLVPEGPATLSPCWWRAFSFFIEVTDCASSDHNSTWLAPAPIWAGIQAKRHTGWGSLGPQQWEVGTSVLEVACAVWHSVCQPARELASWKLPSVWHGEPSQASLLRYPVSQLLVTLVRLKTFRLQAVWWKRLLRVTVCALVLQEPCAGAFPSVCHSFALLCYCIPGVDAPTVGNCELAVLLLSSSTYCLSLSYRFYFCAVNANQPEKRWLCFHLCRYFWKQCLCLFQHHNELVCLRARFMRSVQK